MRIAIMSRTVKSGYRTRVFVERNTSYLLELSRWVGAVTRLLPGPGAPWTHGMRHRAAMTLCDIGRKKGNESALGCNADEIPPN
ncbi:hypothetical protein AB0D04_17550 [Streptomyces sp. NPDC048483]|uniref:hypothetical protein n=1 Tax=Streptomyces sp. NPDC048483 TaxID=3154927 RepID=UPI003412BCB4